MHNLEYNTSSEIICDFSVALAVEDDFSIRLSSRTPKVRALRLLFLVISGEHGHQDQMGFVKTLEYIGSGVYDGS